MHEFQRNIVMSHATGLGPDFASSEVRAIMLVRLNGMCRGGSGVQPAVFDRLLAMLNAGIHPAVPSRGSTGMSDLAPLAHMALPLIGLGEVEYRGQRMPSRDALELAGLGPVELGPKDGLALCSANSASVGHGALVVDRALELLASADLAAALSLEAFQGHTSPLDERTHTVRPYTGELVSAAAHPPTDGRAAASGAASSRRPSRIPSASAAFRRCTAPVSTRWHLCARSWRSS